MTSSCLKKTNEEISRIYADEEIALIDKRRIPRHVAIIPDGNRRWARQQDSAVSTGHREGADTIMDIVKAAKELGVKVITLYLFSTENWERSQEEVDALMWLLQSYLIEQRPTLLLNGIRLQTIGDLSLLPPSVLETVHETKAATAHCDKIEMVFALNYGSRNEICRAFKTILNEVLTGKLKQEEVSEDIIARHLDTAPWGDPDLLIRTSGEMRLSNFLLWQISYSEFYMENVFWPAFTPQHFLKALLHFQSRERRLGGT
jgi:undecaprenyl diphosphate synthase